MAADKRNARRYREYLWLDKVVPYEFYNNDFSTAIFYIFVSLSWDNQLFHDGGSYHIETSPFICSANQWTGFYMIGTSVMKELTSIWT